MKTIIALCVLVLALGSFFTWRATRMPNQYGAFTGAPAAEVADLIARPTDFLHKTVSISGEVREQCTTMGCYFFFLSGNERLRVDLVQIAMDAPRKNGHIARVEGQLVPFDHSFQVLASAVEFR